MSKDISIVSTELPAHIKLGSALGNENVSSEHLSVPRVKQLQKMSNEVDENHSDYMDGAKVGDFVTFSNATWASSSFTARGALIYNDTQGDKAVMVLDFGANKTSNNSAFTVAMPASTASTALIRIT